MMKKVVVVGLFIVLVAWAYQAIHPPPPKKLSSSLTPRIKLRDGRHLVYKEYGVAKERANYKAIFIHSFGNCKYEAVLVTSGEVLEELGVYLVSFDRPGYGESEPHPQRTMKSFALDVEDLADQLGLGTKFYVIGYSMGGLLTWGCLKYIPERLAGVTLLAPGINYWWPGFPSNLTEKAFSQLPRYQWAFRVAHYAPWLVYWWNTQKWFPSLSIMDPNPIWYPQDLEIYSKIDEELLHEAYVTQQGDYESLHRDLIMWCRNWEFDPIDLKNPFPNREGSVHLWQGVEDPYVLVALQRYIVQKISWIQYHELKESGHLFPYADSLKDIIWKTFFK